MYHLRHQNHKNENLHKTWKNKVLKVKNSPLELGKDFKPINTSAVDMGKIGVKRN